MFSPALKIHEQISTLFPSFEKKKKTSAFTKFFNLFKKIKQHQDSPTSITRF